MEIEKRKRKVLSVNIRCCYYCFFFCFVYICVAVCLASYNEKIFLSFLIFANFFYLAFINFFRNESVQKYVCVQKPPTQAHIYNNSNQNVNRHNPFYFYSTA